MTVCPVLVPGLHAWFDLHHFVRDVDDTNEDFSGLRMGLTLQEVVHTYL